MAEFVLSGFLSAGSADVLGVLLCVHTQPFTCIAQKLPEICRNLHVDG